MQQVQCIEIHHSYDGTRDAVSNLSLTVERGEVLALIGPNGAGKSTTLRILATLQKPDRGQLLWDGCDAWQDRYSIRQRIGFLGDGTGLYPAMSAAGYLRFFAECYGLADGPAAARVRELLELFQLSSKANSTIAEMSKGMRQRLAIARTLVQGPELLLLDEPADGLDPLARRQLREVLRRVADEGVAIVISSHILRELDGFCDAVAVIQRGKLEVHGTVDDVIQGYEVTRRVHEVQITRGLQRALEILRKHEGLVESVNPLSKHESMDDSSTADRGLVRVRIRGDEQRAATILREMILADVDVISLAKIRSDLEDVYSSLGRDAVG